MTLEIEFEPDEGPGRAWPDEAGAPGAEQLGSQPPPWRTSDPLLHSHARLVLAVLVLATACVTGFLAGRTAQRDLHVLSVQAAATGALAIDPLPDPYTAASTQSPATPWTGDFDRAVALTLVNSGPDPVTLLAGTLDAPQISPAAVLPARQVIGSGAELTLHTRAHFDCVDFALHMSVADSFPTATTARLDVLTADGVTHRVDLLVDAFGAAIENDVCMRLQNPEVFGRPVFGAAAVPGSFTATVPVLNRAPFPLRANLDQGTADAWMNRAGLIVTTGESIIPAESEGRIDFTVLVVDCVSARAAAATGLGFETLVFTDARLSLNDPLAQQFDQAFMAGPAADAIGRVCGDR